VRFYRHLAGNFAGTFEAAEAVSALHRLDEAGLRPALSRPKISMALEELALFTPPRCWGRQDTPPQTLGHLTLTIVLRHRLRGRPTMPPPGHRCAGRKGPLAPVIRTQMCQRSCRALGSAVSWPASWAVAAGLFLPAARTANTVAAGVLASPLIAAAFAMASLVVLLVGLVARAVFAMAMRQAHDALQKQSGDADHDDE
jgi:hypothetical protein